MWGFIITIVVLIVIKFIYDTVKQSSKIAADGGIRKKYSTLVEHFLSGYARHEHFLTGGSPE